MTIDNISSNYSDTIIPPPTQETIITPSTPPIDDTVPANYDASIGSNIDILA
jgi:hypothetical protein